MSQKDKVLGILQKAIKIMNLGLDILDPSVKAVPLCKYHEIRKAAQQIQEEAQELP